MLIPKMIQSTLRYVQTLTKFDIARFVLELKKISDEFHHVEISRCVASLQNDFWPYGQDGCKVKGNVEVEVRIDGLISSVEVERFKDFLARLNILAEETDNVNLKEFLQKLSAKLLERICPMCGGAGKLGVRETVECERCKGKKWL